VQNTVFIINPFSAKKNYQPFLEELKKKVDNPRYYISKSVEDTERFIMENFENTEIFVAVGGDGTVSTIAKNIVGTDKILAIYPAGSGNGFSKETKFHKNLDKLIKKINTKKTKQIDTFTVNDRFSINISGVGFDGEIAKEFDKTDRGLKNYIKISAKTFFKYKPIEIDFFDEKYNKYSGKYLMLNIANTRQFGNNAYIAPRAIINDGFLDLVLVKKIPLFYIIFFVFRLFTKTLKTNKYITYVSISETSFRVNTENWQLDGEFCKIKSPINIKTNPYSLKILI
jgi:YegS/Rv2252/BmrU family lipid kinase